MTELLYSPKIKPEHLVRKAIVYLRQSSEKQVRQNKESQQLQYDLAERVRALGWKEVEIIDDDLGASAATGAAPREGFERVLSSVALGEVGIRQERGNAGIRTALPPCGATIPLPVKNEHHLILKPSA